MPLESGLVFPSPCPMAAQAEWEAGSGSEDLSLPREAISLVCEAVPGAKGATRRRKVPWGRWGWRCCWETWGGGGGGGFLGWGTAASESLGPSPSPVAAHSAPSWGGVT